MEVAKKGSVSFLFSLALSLCPRPPFFLFFFLFVAVGALLFYDLSLVPPPPRSFSFPLLII